MSADAAMWASLAEVFEIISLIINRACRLPHGWNVFFNTAIYDILNNFIPKSLHRIMPYAVHLHFNSSHSMGTSALWT